METKDLTKIERRKHRWSTNQRYDLTPMYWDMGFVLCSLVFGGMAVGAFWYAKELWVILALYASIFAMIILFSINIIRLVKHLAEMLCAVYHVVRVNVDEQKDMDFGYAISYYDPVSQVEISEERYEEMRCAEQQKEREKNYQENMCRGLEGEVERKKMEEKRKQDALEAARKTTVIVPHDLDAIRKGEEE